VSSLASTAEKCDESILVAALHKIVWFLPAEVTSCAFKMYSKSEMTGRVKRMMYEDVQLVFFEWKLVVWDLNCAFLINKLLLVLRYYGIPRRREVDTGSLGKLLSKGRCLTIARQYMSHHTTIGVLPLHYICHGSAYQLHVDQFLKNLLAVNKSNSERTIR
jgi:hypothetical protein